ncbi:hypothetical protein EYF80_014376 [Liparis tanakae]|uniref:Uncharacterized protein n=1 Tax=Liparis tanakae TaxID=230148 RepID=A0A4Z2IB82_9TELE|nr:hypothetical protein EYF80_014376 [Liparis tanakae]
MDHLPVFPCELYPHPESSTSCEHVTYLCAATARLFRYFCAVMTPTNRNLLDRVPGFSVAAFFNSVALGKMSLEASVNPTTSPNRTLNHALRLRPAIPQNFSSSLCILAVSYKKAAER